MNYQNKGLQVSFAIHAIVFIIISGISNLATPLAKPIVIDFSIVDSANDKGAISQTPGTKKQNAIASRVPEMKPAIGETQGSDIQSLSPALSETQVPVKALEEKSLEAKEPEYEAAKRGDTDMPSGHPNPSETETSIGGSGTPDGDRKAVYLKQNFSYIRDIIQKNITYPKVAREMGWEGKVMVSFIVSFDGRVREIKITQSSGIEILDRGAVEAVKKASPFPKPPVEAQVIIPIVYRLN